MSKKPTPCAKCRRKDSVIAKMTTTINGREPKQVYFDEKWVATRWGCSVQLVRKLRSQGDGPEITYFGRAVRYRLRRIIAYERAGQFQSTSEKDVLKRKSGRE